MRDGMFPKDLTGVRVHFIGIGGIGMSALARIALAKGAVVSGCDCSDSSMLSELRALGCTCHVGHSASHLDETELAVYSSAVAPETGEMRAALSRDLKVFSRGRMLACLQRGHETIAVAGAHGKTTTTWIIGNMLIRAGLDPSIAVGGIVTELGGNARLGGGVHFVTEADESDGSFLHLVAKYPVITNIDNDHMDYYRDMDAVERAFVDFAAGGEGGAVIACIDCPHVRAVLPRIGSRVVTYGIGQGDVAARNPRAEPTGVTYDATLPSGRVEGLTISLPGLHNVRNSLAALALADLLGLPMDRVREAFGSTSRVGRRMEKRGVERGVTVYDDYAHHPTEIRATLEAARTLARGSGRLVGVFQPHRYTRTQQLHEEFGPVFDELDFLVITPIYAASERPIEGVTSGLIAEAVGRRGRVRHELVSDLGAATDLLARELHAGDVLITLGAGDVRSVGDGVLDRIRRAGMRAAATT